MFTKRNILLLIAILLIVVFIAIYFFFAGRMPALPTATPVPTLFPNPVYFEPSKSFTLIYEDPQHNYKISQVSTKKEYLISILGSPFSKYRDEAEKTFLSLLKLSKDEACKLRVSITTPYFANPDESGQIYSLSFCPSG